MRQWRRCTTCGSEFPDPAPTAEELAAAYNPAYYGERTDKFIRQIEWVISGFRSRRARYVLSVRPGKGRLLDIGCGSGDFLCRCQDFGFEVSGTELPGIAADRARRRLNGSVFSGTLSEANYPDRYFDVIVIWHVFEHLTEPRQYLAEISRIIKPGGVLLLAIPNIESAQARFFRGKWFHLDPPRHLFFMPPDRVEAALAGFGFTVHSLSHFSFEQNIFGWIQSSLNCLFGERDFLYECLKGNFPAGKKRRFSAIVQLILAAALVPAAIVFSLVESLARRGGSFAGVYQKSGSSSQQL